MKRFFVSLVLAILLSITFGGMAVGGNNGTVKIIDATGDYDLDKDNDPHVCAFYVAGFNFDSGQTGTYTITGQAPTADRVGTSGSYRANADGKWATPTVRLMDGHYKLDVQTGQGDGKHKVFWVDCQKSDQKPTAKPTAPVYTTAPPKPSCIPSAATFWGADATLTLIGYKFPDGTIHYYIGCSEQTKPINSLPNTSTK